MSLPSDPQTRASAIDKLADALASLIEAEPQKVRSAGVSMRLRSEINPAESWGVQTMPLAGRGPIHIGAEALEPALLALGAGDRSATADALLGAFFEVYWFTPDPVDLGEIEWVDLEVASGEGLVTMAE